jgi:hypothetical protein
MELPTQLHRDDNYDGIMIYHDYFETTETGQHSTADHDVPPPNFADFAELGALSQVSRIPIAGLLDSFARVGDRDKVSNLLATAM